MLTAQPWSFDETKDLLAPHLAGISGVTVVTHGWQAVDTGGDSLKDLSAAVYKAAERQFGSGAAWLLDYDVSGNYGNGRFDSEQSKTSAVSPRELILQWDWAPETNEYQSGWTEASGDALFASLVGLGLIDPALGEGNTRSFHFIAHSFGCAATSEAIERMAAFDIPVDQVTYLDPHDFHQGDTGIEKPANDFQMEQWTLGTGPAGAAYGATVWDNVKFADVYYQTTSEDSEDGWAGKILDQFIPEGRPIPGAYNVWLSADKLAGGSWSGGDHSDVWEQFYVASINDPFGSNRDSGYRFSRLGMAGGTGQTRPAPVFYETENHPQDHKWTTTQIAPPENSTDPPAAINAS